MKWERNVPAPPPADRSELTVGPLHMSVAQKDDDRRYKHCMIYFGEFSDESHEDCVTKWPREVVKRLREEATRLESEIQED